MDKSLILVFPIAESTLQGERKKVYICIEIGRIYQRILLLGLVPKTD